MSPWCTAFQLWRIKRGDLVDERDNIAMRRGRDMEAEARRAYELHTGLIMQPAYRESASWPVMRASLDGITLDGECFVEIKCPGADDHATAAKRKVPEKYEPQLQHQFCVTGAKVGHYWSYDGAEGILVEVGPSSSFIARLLEAEREFWRCVVSGEAPPLTERDAILRTDEDWLTAARLYREAEAASAEWSQKQAAARELLIGLSDGAARAQGGGVSVTRFDARPPVNIKSIPEVQAVLAEIDVEQYRGETRTQYRITVTEK